MTTLEFCQSHVVFARSGSPITGPFRIEMYPFLRKPFEVADDVRVKRLVIYKASSAMGTVAGQCIMAKRILYAPGDMLFCAQTDDDASTWAKTRGKEFLLSIPDISRFVSRSKYAVTNDLLQFRGKFLAITGPGISSAQSLQCTTLLTDESHLESYPSGRLIEFEKRLGGRWNRLAVHVTTAPDAGREVDNFYLAGQQDEWYFRCPSCSQLTRPLWGSDAIERYSVPVFYASPSGDIEFRCPHCAEIYRDNARERYALVRNGDYVSANPSAPSETRSFQWSVWAMHPIPWREIATEHAHAMASARLGDLKPLEDFTKKRLCKAWTPTVPDFGEGKGANDYALGDAWNRDTARFCGIDRQAGTGDEGEHLWVLIVEYDRAGNSRRLAFRKVQTFAQAEALVTEFNVKPGNVYCDSGYENRSTFRECGRRKWFTTRGTDEAEFLHSRKLGDKIITYPLPYSEAILQSGIVGQAQPDKRMRTRGSVPDGWAIQIAMANPTLYGYLSALIGGSSGRYFGIARDMPTEYAANMPAFIAIEVPDKLTATVKKIAWRKIRADHAHDCEVQCLLGAIRAGYFPLAGAGVEAQG